MNHRAKNVRPLARKEGLVVQELPDEILVYDLDRDKAHCLNETAAMVWRKCDGRATTTAISKALENELRKPVDEKIVWLALDQLGRNNLLEQIPAPPPVMNGLNRREMVRALGIAAAVAIPVVTSIVAPTPAQAATCLPSGASCTSNAQCCSGTCAGLPGPGTCA